MKLKKILIVPSDAIVESASSISSPAFFIDFAKAVKRAFYPIPYVYDAELQRYADIPKILGKDSTFIFGRMHYYLHSASIPEFCPYPSCHGTPKGTSIKASEIDGVMKSVDAVLVSTRAGWRGKLTTIEAKKRGIPVAMIDAHDHPSNYAAVDIRRELCRGFEKGIHFDIYFKNDLPLGYRTESILPLAPCPLRPEFYTFASLKKDLSIFYSGRPRPRCQPDRYQTVALAAQFPKTLVLDQDFSRSTFMSSREYCRNLSRAELALSPSGKVWDSLRHCETGFAPGTALIAPKPYVETVGPPLRDGVNAILYNTEFKDGKSHLKDAKGLAEKIRYYLDNPAKRKRIADQWAEEVRQWHTIYARSRYILESIEKII